MLFYNLAFFKSINEERSSNVALGELHDVKLDFRFGLQPVMRLTGLC
jgi:hypothetical protein